MIHEDAMHVRAGNMGNEYGCVWGQTEIGNRFYVGLIFSPTKLWVWPNEGPISRYSWRPKSPAREFAFTWIMPEIGYIVADHKLVSRVSIGTMWPTSTGGAWGAPVGMAPGFGTEIGFRLGSWLTISGVGKLVWNRATGWVVLNDWSTPHGEEIKKSHYWLTPVAIFLGVRF